MPGFLKRILLGASALSLMMAGAQAAELTKIKIGVLKVSACGPVFFAKEKGYFAKEGLDAELIPSDSPILIPQGVLSGDFDFGMSAMSAGFFNSAAPDPKNRPGGSLFEILRSPLPASRTFALRYSRPLPQSAETVPMPRLPGR